MHKEKVQESYNKDAKLYDDTVSLKKWWAKSFLKLSWGFSDASFLTDVLNNIPINFSGKLLDIPVGTGVFTGKKYASLKNAEIIAMDYSEEMLKYAEQEYKRLGANVTLSQGDVSKLPFDSNSFDIVLCMNGIPCFAEKEKSLSELLRVLKPNGLFIGSMYVKRERWLSDLFFGKLFAWEGITTPPFYTKYELIKKLEPYSDKINMQVKGTMCRFCCIKK